MSRQTVCCSSQTTFCHLGFSGPGSSSTGISRSDRRHARSFIACLCSLDCVVSKPRLTKLRGMNRNGMTCRHQSRWMSRTLASLPPQLPAARRSQSPRPSRPQRPQCPRRPWRPWPHVPNVPDVLRVPHVPGLMSLTSPTSLHVLLVQSLTSPTSPTSPTSLTSLTSCP